MRGKFVKSRGKYAGCFFALLFICVECFVTFGVFLHGEDMYADATPRDGYTPIYTACDLLAVADKPDGSYILMRDIDMAGVCWKPIDFSGIFDGNGHALLNLSVTQTGDTTADTYDGNMKVYDTSFAGLFCVLSNATVSELTLINYKAVITSDTPCFVGSIAGYCEGSMITGCHISAYIELNAYDRMFGVGGIVGYGNGHIENTGADVTLVCTDTDAGTRDEQFMGGAYGAGYMDLDGCNIAINGYGSEHGYVHNGGVAGMYMLYPAGTGYEGYLTNTRVTGRISFYEDNTDRRAYCKDFIGEVLNWTYQIGGNSSDFTVDERFDYSVDLKPHMCDGPSYTKTYFDADCDSYGYTLFHCGNCGYEYADNYTLRRHTVTEWTVVRQPTEDIEGTREGICLLCGRDVQDMIDRLPTQAEVSGASYETSETYYETTESAGNIGTDIVETEAEQTLWGSSSETDVPAGTTGGNNTLQSGDGKPYGVQGGNMSGFLIFVVAAACLIIVLFSVLLVRKLLGNTGKRKIRKRTSTEKRRK